MPLSRLPDPDSELPPPIPLPDDPSGRTLFGKDGWPGVPYLAVAALLCLGGGYGATYVVELWPWSAALLLTAGPLAGMSFGVWLVRKGIVNPFTRKFRRWRGRAVDWQVQTEHAKAEADQVRDELDQINRFLDEVARYVTGADDPHVAQRLLQERLERQKAGKRRGRPPRTPNGVSYEAAVETGRKIRRDVAGGMSWINAATREGVSVEAARTRVQWANDEDAKQKGSA
jgi:hypothetical protein